MIALEPHTLAAVAAVTLLAAFVQGVTGFGSALLAMPLLALCMDVRSAAPLVALLSLAINLVLLVPAARRLPWRRVAPLLGGSVAGIPVGVIFLAGADDRLARAGLGVALVISSLCLLRLGRLTLRPGTLPALAVGTVAGVLGGAFNTTGPPIVLYAATQPWDKRETHATLQLYFLASGLGIAALHALSGLTNRTVVLAALAALPALAAGSVAGYAVHRRVSEGRFRTLLQATLLVAGIALMLTGGRR